MLPHALWDPLYSISGNFGSFHSNSASPMKHSSGNSCTTYLYYSHEWLAFSQPATNSVYRKARRGLPLYSLACPQPRVGSSFFVICLATPYIICYSFLFFPPKKINMLPWKSSGRSLNRRPSNESCARPKLQKGHSISRNCEASSNTAVTMESINVRSLSP